MGDNRKDVLIRTYIVFGFMVVFGSAIVGRIWQLQNVQGGKWRAMADSLTTQLRRIDPSRGNIYSSDGRLLATSVPIYDLRVDMMADGITKESFNSNVDSLSAKLSALFNDKPASEYKHILREARRDGERFFLLKKNVSYQQMMAVKTFPLFRLGRYKGGLIVEQKSRRERPFKLLAARMIGYQRDGLIPVGIEGSYNDHLKGVNGIRLMQRISGSVWKPLRDENEIDPQDGNDVISTIDINIQDVAENSLLTQLQQHNAEKGCAVLMEVKTGHVLAIANLTMGKDGNYFEDYNLAIGESTEPGSTMKLASLMAMYEDGFAQPEDLVDTQGGAVRYANRIMKDSHEGGYGIITLQHAFELSSNVGISKMVNRVYAKNPQAFVDRLKSFGLGTKLGLQVTGEGSSYLRETSSKYWSRTSLPWLSIGYECSLTPLQVLTLYNAVANNGKMVRPLFVKEIRNKGQLVQEFRPSVIKDSIASPTTIKFVKQALEGVVERGTATNLKNAQYKVAGKTGTAQIANLGKGYKDGKIRYQASFVGYFPADEPMYSCMVVVYAPNNNLYYASQVAAPIFKEIADKVYASNIELHKELKYEETLANNLPAVKTGTSKSTREAVKGLGIPMKSGGGEGNWVAVNWSGQSVEMKDVIFRHDQVPSVMGMGLRDALYLLESHGLTVKAVGRGKVIRQSVVAGSKIEKGGEIIIQLG